MITTAWLVWQFQVMMHAVNPVFYPAVEYQEPAKYVQHQQVQRPGLVKPAR